MFTGFQIRATGTIAVVHRYSRRQEVGILGFEKYRFCTLTAKTGTHSQDNLLLPPSFPHLPQELVEGNTVSQTKALRMGEDDAAHQRVKHPCSEQSHPNRNPQAP